MLDKPGAGGNVLQELVNQRLHVAADVGCLQIGVDQPDATGRMGIEMFPDDFTITTNTGNAAFLFTDAARTIITDIPAGGGLGNDQAVAGMDFRHTMRFDDPGNLFASQLLINAAVQVELAANIGPLYLFLE